ncbi:ROK family protein [Rothia sp. P7208]|uniref:ROK family protein n=1 Tax=Rothia sp. P7208 TaxID=3402660 RepID=UPI003AD2F434
MENSTVVAISVDLGGTKTALGIVDQHGAVLHRAEIPTLAQLGGVPLAKHTAEAVLEHISYARSHGWDVAGVGIGSAGVIDENGTVVTAANVIKDWTGVQFASIVESMTSLPTCAVNDVHAHALGEAWLGAAAQAPSSLMMAFGTGVGGSYIEDGKLMRGAHSLAGHTGHFSSPLAVGLDCPCGGRGHVEAVAAGPAVLRKYLALGGAPAPDTKEVSVRAQNGDKLAQEAIVFAGQAAGIALGDLATIFDPHLIVVSGGVVNLGDRWWTALLDSYAQAALGQAKSTPIVLAELGSDAPLIGAASLIHRSSLA